MVKMFAENVYKLSVIYVFGLWIVMNLIKIQSNINNLSDGINPMSDVVFANGLICDNALFILLMANMWTGYQFFYTNKNSNI